MIIRVSKFVIFLIAIALTAFTHFSGHELIYGLIPILIPVYLDGKFRYWTKVLWWVSFFGGTTGVFDNIYLIIGMYQLWNINNTSLDYRHDIFNLMKVTIKNITNGYIAWKNA